MKLDSKLIIYLCIFAVVDIFVPIPIMSIFLLYIVLNKPNWFKEMVTEIYLEK